MAGLDRRQIGELVRLAYIFGRSPVVERTGDAVDGLRKYDGYFITVSQYKDVLNTLPGEAGYDSEHGTRIVIGGTG